MKKKKVFENILLIFIVVSILLMHIPAVSDVIFDKVIMPLAEPLFVMIDNWDYHQRRLADDREDDVYASDTWGTNFEYNIEHYFDGTAFEYKVSEDEKLTLLENIDLYMFFEHNMYMVSKDGYAIVPENGKIKIYFKTQNSDKMEHENIKYIDSFEEFEKEEKRRLKRLQFYADNLLFWE